MEIMLIGREVLGFRIVSCRYDTSIKGYIIGYRCLRCGKFMYTRMISSKVCILRCNICNRIRYIAPIVSNNTGGEIVGYYIIDTSRYRLIRKRYKEVNGDVNFIKYIDDFMRNRD